MRSELLEALEGARAVFAPTGGREIAELWRWRHGVSGSVTAMRGGKMSEDVVVPLEHLAGTIDAVVAIGRRHDLESCSWGHAGDGNLHATFLLDDRGDPDQWASVERAIDELLAHVVRIDGSVSGEHGVGWLKRGALQLQLAAPELELHTTVKQALDPSGLFNPGKKQQ